MEQQIRFCVTTEDVHLAYSTVGQGPPLVLPPGWISHLELEWEFPPRRAFYEKLAAHHTVIIYDKHGCGLSDRERHEFTLENEVRDLEAVINHLKLERFALLGISQAGSTAIAFTAKHPQRVSQLLLYGAYSRGDNLAKDEVKSSLISLVRAHWGFGSKTLADLFIPGSGSDPDMLEAFSQLQRKSTTAENAARLLECSYQIDVTDLLPNIVTPTVVIHRQGDRVVHPRCGRELAASIPNASFVPLEGNMHLPHFGDVDALIRVIHKFLGARTIPTPKAPAEKVAEQGLQRKLAAILSADVNGYSRLMSNDEQATVETITAYRKIMTDLIHRHHGTVVDAKGDNVLAEFPSVVNAIQCAVEIQKELKVKNADLSDHRRMEFRIGVNLGDVIEKENTIYGDGVNIAARIESLAESGGICISGTVYDHVKSKVELEYEFLGEQSLKNISEQVRAYRVEMEHKDAKGGQKVHKIY
jgi:class 3 adenylate cyclase/pimeloyl-ACP methyl ester carboxylesterase